MSTKRTHERRLTHAPALPNARPALHGVTNALLVAIEETNDNRGVLSVAELLARRARINAHLIAVAEPKSGAVDRLPREDLEAIHENQLHRLRSRTKRRLHQTIGRGMWWSTSAAIGTLATALASQADERSPRMVLLAASALDDSTRRSDVSAVMRAVNAVDAPVLLVPAHQEILPIRALVATDFSLSSKRAARAAISVIGARGRLTLVHIEPELDFEAPGDPGSREANQQGIERLFHEFGDELEAEAALSTMRSRRAKIVKDTVLLRGDAASVILDYAARHNVDLIVVGTRRIRLEERIPLGSVSMAVLQRSTCAVLVAQPPIREGRDEVAD